MGSFRKLSTSGLAAGALIASSVAMIGSAWAATAVTINAGGVISPDPIGASQITVTSNYAQALWVEAPVSVNGTACAGSSLPSACKIDSGSSLTLTVDSNASSDDFKLYTSDTPDPSVLIGMASISYVPGESDDSSTEAVEETGPRSVIQQFGLPASGTCEERAPANMDVAGVGSGGWGVSWARWMNEGDGGAVCTRKLSYVESGWTVG